MVFCSPVFAQGISSGGEYSLAGQVTSGGGALSGGVYRLVGEAGLPAAGESAGGGFTLLNGGFGLFSVPFGDFSIEIQVSRAGEIRVSWPEEAVGYHLEFSPALGPAAFWQAITPVTGQNSYTSLVNQSARFYRLKR